MKSNHVTKRAWDETTEGVAKRPYRIWDAKKKRDVRYRYYVIKKNALDGALLEVRWGKMGDSLARGVRLPLRHFVRRIHPARYHHLVH